MKTNIVISFIVYLVAFLNVSHLMAFDGELGKVLKQSKLNHWRDVNEKTIDVTTTLLASTIPTAFADNITEQCQRDSQHYLESLLQRNVWALQMYESNGQYPEGLIGGGNYHAVGLFDECIDTREPLDSFSGEYCTVFFRTSTVRDDDLADDNSRANEWLTIFQIVREYFNETDQLKEARVADVETGDNFLPSTGLCLPSSCSARDVRQSVAQLVGLFTIAPNTSIVTIGDESYCYSRQKLESSPDFKPADICVITLLSLLGLLLIVATGYDSWRTYQSKPIDVKSEGKLIGSLHCFSALRNAKTLLNTRSTVGPDSIDCLSGIRVFATTWVILGHAWRYPLKRTNFVYNLKMSQQDVYTDWMLQTVLNNSVTVDTFFLMSAMLVTGSLLRELDRNKGSFNAILFYVHRYLRLTAVYAIVLGFIATVYAYLGTGPNWREIQTLSEACQKNWWQNLLYINNFYYSFDAPMCMGESWYLAVDMQLFVIAPFLIYPLWKWPKAGLLWIAGLFVASTSATIALFTIWDDIPPTLQSTMPATRYDTDYYALPWYRCPAYLIGVLFGWFLHKTRGSTVHLKKSVVLGGWSAAVAIGALVVYGLVPYMDERNPVPDVARVFYASFHRPAWTIAIAWVIFACLKGYGGIANRFLSSGAFTVLGRITYAVYLIHLNLLALYYAQTRKPFYYTRSSQVGVYLALVLASFLGAFAVCLAVEVPLLNLERLHIGRPAPAKRSAPSAPKESSAKTQMTTT